MSAVVKLLMKYVYDIFLHIYDSAPTAKPSLTITHVGKVATTTGNVVSRASSNTTSGN